MSIYRCLRYTVEQMKTKKKKSCPYITHFDLLYFGYGKKQTHTKKQVKSL